MVGASFVTAAAEVIRAKKGITAVGNAQVSTAQSKFGGSSALFDGTGDYLTTSNLSVGSGAFTIEFFIRFTTLPAARSGAGWQMAWTGESANSYILMWSDGIQLAVNNTFGGFLFGSTMSTNTWYHIAIVRSSADYKVFFNGTDCGSATDDGSGAQSWANRSGTVDWTGTGTQYIGTYSGNTAKGIIGYIDEVRISDTARYTTTFTPSTTPFVNDANTLLLIHADGTDASTFFEDDNGVRGPKAIRRLGNGSISTTQSKFGGASLDLTGTTNTTALRGAYASDLSVGTGDFTIETWVRFTGSEASGQYNQIFGQWQNPYVSLFYVLGTIGTGSTQSMVLQLNNAVTSNTASTTGLFTTGVWYHIAVTRSSGTIRFFKDGTQVTTTSNSTNTQNLTGVSDFGIGYNVDANTQKLVGYLDDLRVSNSARYTANFTAPTAPHVNDANTLLLLHMDGTNGSTDFRDDVGEGRAARGIVSSGASTSTTQSKFGSTSASFSGTNYLAVYGDTSSTWALSGDLTVEFWFYQTSTSNATYIDSRNGGNSFALNLLQVSQKLSWYAGGGMLIQESGTISTNTWTHCALVRSGSTFTLYKNGTSVGTYSSSSTFASQLTLAIGTANSPDFGANSSSHFQDEIRISNSARYTANFTPATAPFQNDANTLLLIHADGTNAATVFTDDNGKRPV